MFASKSSIFLYLILLTGCVLQGVVAMLTSLNRTEVAHLGAASYFWRTGRFDLFHVNSPLGRMLTGWPTVLPGTQHDLTPYSPRPQDRSEWAVGESFVKSNSPEVVWRTYVLGRLMCIPIILAGGIAGSVLARQMFGKGSAVVYAVLWSFSPLFLGWSPTMCPDMIAASLGIIAVYFFRRWLIGPTWKRAVVAGIFLGLLPLAKMTWILAFGLFPLIWLLSTERPAWKQMAVIMLLALYMLNMGYGFDGTLRPLKDYDFISRSLGDRNGEGTSNRFAGSLLGHVPVPLPSEFVLGIDTQKRDFENGIESYLFGRYSNHGWWYYYFVVLPLKEPTGTLLLFALAVFLAIFNRDYRASRNDELLILLPFAVLFLTVTMQTGFSIHPRYILPAMPFFYLFASRTGKVFSSSKRPLRGIVTLSLAATVIGSLWVYPYSMSYINELVPVRKRPELVLGSNIDWGQDAWFLKRWVDQHPEIPSIRIEYPCPEKIERVGVKSSGPPPMIPEPGWFALGINDIYASSGKYAYFKGIDPVDRIGYSIEVFHLSEADVRRLREQYHFEEPEEMP